MDAVKFIKERNRMCKTYNTCGNCPLYCGAGCKVISQIDPEVVVPIVDQWAKEHPVKTRQSEFLKLFPNAMVYANTKNIAINPCIVDTTLQGHCPTGRGYDDCRREFWSQEVE